MSPSVGVDLPGSLESTSFQLTGSSLCRLGKGRKGNGPQDPYRWVFTGDPKNLVGSKEEFLVDIPYHLRRSDQP